MLKIRPCCFKMAPEHRVLMLGIQISQKALARPSNSRYPPAAWEYTDQRCRRKAAHHWVRLQGREHKMKIFPQWVYMYHLSSLIEFSNSLGAHSLFIYFPVSLNEWLVWVWYICWLDCQIYSRGKINSTPYPDHSLMCLCRWLPHQRRNFDEFCFCNSFKSKSIWEYIYTLQYSALLMNTKYSS